MCPNILIIRVTQITMGFTLIGYPCLFVHLESLLRRPYCLFAAMCVYCDFNRGVIRIELNYYFYQEQNAEIFHR